MRIPLRPSLLSGLMLLMFFSPPASAGPGSEQGGPPDPGIRKGGNPPPDHEQRIVKELDLTQDQIEQFRKIRQESREKFEKQREKFAQQWEKVRAAHDKLTEALKGTASDKELRKLFAELQTARKTAEEMRRPMRDPTFEETRFEEVLKIRAILTPEQRKKFEAFPKPWAGRDERSRRGRPQDKCCSPDKGGPSDRDGPPAGFGPHDEGGPPNLGSPSE